ncbi:hypothetical protein CTI12_AA488240 [Artemisia annua]|uniref:Uncharacterized protein n=1 Tax=Artemisia annua TaxID=35608 RepID=A0A2U1LJQ5_ARTAN|nr:hypothetical protein CTI12_AA488240 [Artemisia annua]
MPLTTYPHSASKEQSWVDQISRKLDTRKLPSTYLMKPPIYVFRFPISISLFKSEAYLPHVSALVPYHHLDPHLYKKERYKIACAKSFFEQNHCREGNIKFQELLIDKINELDPVAYGCYHSYCLLGHR